MTANTPVRGAGRALVVGASSGIGAALVRRLVAEGYSVAAVARRRELLDDLARDLSDAATLSGGRILVRAHDAARAHEVPELFAALVGELGGLDLLVYAAGIMPKVGPAEYDTEKDLDQLAVNVGGCIAWCNAAARLFQTQRSGTIVGISSIAGDRGRKGNPVYCTTKAAMNTYLEALRNRLAEHGVHVTTIKPGFVDTDMTKGLPGLFWLISADRAAELVLRAARGRANVRYVPRRWWLVGSVIRCIPSFLFKKMNV
ncbi:MAG: SDR family NAD(P)-dependent oxidoreductase [Planctomycetes bacterium]|nr:SDR family NAD(P)-dependent oxidoreductase [Planctomycetota bacterium]